MWERGQKARKEILERNVEKPEVGLSFRSRLLSPTGNTSTVIVVVIVVAANDIGIIFRGG